MNIILNIIFGFAIFLGILFALYFLLNICDFYGNQRELHLKIFFKDKMNFFCAALLLLYMAVVETTTIGIILFFVLLFVSFIFNLVMFSRDSMVLFNNKFKYESIRCVTVKWDKGSPKKIISFEFNDREKKLSYILKAGDVDYLIEKLENKNVAVKKLSR